MSSKCLGFAIHVRDLGRLARQLRGDDYYDQYQHIYFMVPLVSRLPKIAIGEINGTSVSSRQSAHVRQERHRCDACWIAGAGAYVPLTHEGVCVYSDDCVVFDYSAVDGGGRVSPSRERAGLDVAMRIHA